MKLPLRNIALTVAIPLLTVYCQKTSLHAQDYVKPDFMVSDSTGYDYDSPELSVSNAGDMVVVWENTGGGGIWFKTISALGTVLSEQKSVKSTFSHDVTRVAHTDSGNFMIIFGGYQGSWSVYGQAYDEEGNTIGDTINITRNTSEMIQATWASLTADSSNQFVVMLPGFDSMIVEKVSGLGEFIGDPVVLKPAMANIQYPTGLMTRSGHYIMAWLDIIGGNIHGRRFTPEGVPAGESFQVSEKEENSFVKDMALCADTAGNFAVIWTVLKDSIMEMYSQHYSAEGVATGTDARITGGKFTISPKISASMDLDGKYIVAWRDTRSNDTAFIYLQQMDNQGGKVGDVYRATSINNKSLSGSQSSLNQLHPSVRILRDTIYLAWENFNQDINYRQVIYANIQKWRLPATGWDSRINAHVETMIYPNPSAGMVKLITDPAYYGHMELNVYNTAGTLVRQESRSFSGPEITLDLSDVPAGVYYINLRGDSFYSSKPLIILK